MFALSPLRAAWWLATAVHQKTHRAMPRFSSTVTVSRNRPSPTSPEGRARIEAAELKRARRALIADRNAYRSWCGNPCLAGSDRHNPTFVNRSE